MVNNKKAIYVFSTSKKPVEQSLSFPPVEYKEKAIKISTEKEIVSVRINPSNQYVLSAEESRLFLCLKIDLEGTQVTNFERTPVNIALVLDRSGSMDEKGKIEYTKEAARFLIDNLLSTDIISIIAYDKSVEVINSATPVTQKNLLKHKVEGIITGGSTNLSGGLSEGYNQAMKNRKEKYVNRVLLLSDGLANVGVTDEKSLFSLAKNYRKQGISLSTLGMGTGFNEDLMLGLAEYSGGNYYFVKDSEKIPDIFKHELKQLLTIIAQNITVDLYLKGGVELVNIFGNESEKIPGGVRLHLGDMSYGERKVLIVELKVPKHRAGKEKEIAAVRVKYDDILGGRGQIEKEETISVIYTDNPKLVDSKENEEVDKYVRIMCAARIMHRAMKTMDAGLYQATIAMLSEEYNSISEYSKIYSDPWLTEKAEIFKHCADKLEQMVKSGKLSNYDAMKGMRKELHYQEMMMRHHR